MKDFSKNHVGKIGCLHEEDNDSPPLPHTIHRKHYQADCSSKRDKWENLKGPKEKGAMPL